MALLEKLIDALEEGKKIPLKHSLLIASGIEDKKTGERYLKKFDKIKQNYHSFIRKEAHQNYDNLQKAQFISEYLTTPIKYQRNKFLFPEVIDARLSEPFFSGHGNCVGLTCLYNALAEEEGIFTGIYKTRKSEDNFLGISKEVSYHVLSRVIIFGSEYAVENTSPYGFNIKLEGNVGKGSNNELIADVLTSRMFLDSRKALEIVNLAKRISPKSSLIYYNSASYNSSIGNLKSALDDLNKAIEIDPYNHELFKFRSRIKEGLNDKKGAKEDRKISSRLAGK